MAAAGYRPRRQQDVAGPMNASQRRHGDGGGTTHPVVEAWAVLQCQGSSQGVWRRRRDSATRNGTSSVRCATKGSLAMGKD